LPGTGDNLEEAPGFPDPPFQDFRQRAGKGDASVFTHDIE
jgi:hypothetical protein